MNKKIIAAGVLAALATGTAVATQPTGGYIGVLGGQTRLEVDDLDYSTDKITWGLIGGYQFNQNVAVEVGYYKPEKISASSGTTRASLNPKAFVASVIGSYPLNDTWSIHGRIGGASAKVSASITQGTTTSASDTSTEFLYGAGVGAGLGSTKLRLEYQRIDSDYVSTGLVSLSLSWFPGAAK